MESRQYRVYLTPRISKDIYGDEIQISAQILNNGIKTMKKSIDSSDYSIGVYTYGDITIKIINKNGKYNDEFDHRSIFKYSRDLAKIRVSYFDGASELNRFMGIINDEATKQNSNKEEINFRVLSTDSVIRTTNVSGGLVANGILASDAIKSILNQTDITRVLNYDSNNINVDLDYIIDVGSYFDDSSARNALNEILIAANSVLLIDSENNIFVQSRDESSTDILNIYGPYDEYNRQNMHTLKKYNPGKHRTFTSVKINNQVKNDNGFILDYGFRQYEKSFEFITDEATSAIISNRILLEFKTPQVELEIALPTEIVKNANLLDRVSLNYPLRLRRSDNKFLPIIGQTKIGEEEMPLPSTFGDVSISPAIAFKIIEISENPPQFETILKLRQYGWYTDPSSSIIGFARVGESVIGGTGDEADKWNPAFIGGGKIGLTKIA